MSWITLGKKIKEFRKTNNLTQQELADKLGIARSTLSYYEKGTVEPNIYTLLKLSEIMNCSLDYLFDINDRNTTFDYSSYTKKINDESTNKDIQLTIDLLKSLLKKVERSFIELEQSKKRNDLMYEELKRTQNRILKIDELCTKLDSIEYNFCQKQNIEIADELSPNIIKFPKKETSQYRTINVVGKVSAGNPCYAYEEIIDAIKIPSKYLCSSKNYFALKISGDSMNKIFDDGTLVLIEQGSFALDSSIVIALIDTESTVKKIKFNTDTIDLIPQSTNPIHKVQTYQKGEVAVLGTVLGPIDKFLLD